MEKFPEKIRGPIVLENEWLPAKFRNFNQLYFISEKLRKWCKGSLLKTFKTRPGAIVLKKNKRQMNFRIAYCHPCLYFATVAAVKI